MKRKGLTILEVLVASLLLGIVMLTVTLTTMNVVDSVKKEKIRQEVIEYNMSTMEMIKYRTINRENLFDIIGEYEGVNRGADGTLIETKFKIIPIKVGNKSDGDIDTDFTYVDEPSGLDEYKASIDVDSYMYKITIETKARGKSYKNCNITMYVCNKNGDYGI